jgi:hypothetical protein
MGGLYNPPLLQNPADPMWNAGSLQGREIADTAPTDGQALIWSVVQNKWVPGAGGAGSVSWNDINGRPDLSVYALASALNNYVLGSDLATILGGYVTNSGLSTALNDYLLSADLTWGNLGGRPDLSVYALASALSDYLLSADFTWANLGGKPDIGWTFEDTITTWALNSQTEIIHGLGAKPKDCKITLVCSVANNGYSVGDEVKASWMYVNAYYGNTTAYDSTKIYLRFASGHIISNKSGTNTGIVISPSQWNIRVRAY